MSDLAELRVREVLNEERAVNAEVAAKKTALQDATTELNKTLDRIRSECKEALFELNREVTM